jgi:Adenine specific DNA methylase Mod
MEKLKLHSKNITADNIGKIADLFPNCITETQGENGEVKQAIDFDLLRQELSSNIVEGQKERYQLNWPGKREALLNANAPIAKTLRPCREESVDFDTTENLFIEGDNLDALKLLQETYLGKVKMIYIDPPYNTGKDFIYSDNFAESANDYLLESEQKDAEGNRLVTNADSNGRFHSDWLSMMYSRLKLARNLLKEDGVIFISIDDNEQVNLKRLCDEVFGEENHIGNIVWKNVTDNNPTNIAVEHEYIIGYAKNRPRLKPVWKSKISDIKNLLIKVGDDLIYKYQDPDELQKVYSKWFRENKNQLWPLENYKFIDKQGVYSGERGVHNPGKEGYRYDIIHPETKKACKEPLMGYRFPENTMTKMIEEGRIIFGEDENKLVEIKVYAKDYQQKLSSVVNLDGRAGANELKELFPSVKKVFTNPKTIKILEELTSFASEEDDIILDFFAGSATTAHAVMDLNAQDGGIRKFILVQLPEECNEKSEAFNVGFNTIAEISKERIRRAGEKIKKDNAEKEGIDKLDTGFRVLKIDSSNMQDVYYQPDEITQASLFETQDNIKADRTEEDLLFQVLLDWGVDLSLKIVREEIEGENVYFVDDNALAACFITNGKITNEICKAIAERKPLRVVFRDSGFANDDVKTNLSQIFKQLSPSTDIKVL